MDLEQAKIYVELLKTISNFGPAQQEVDGHTDERDRLGTLARLSFLEIIPSGPESKSRAPTQPFILAGFSYLTDDFEAGGDQLTIICKLEIYSAKPALHSSFESLSPKKPSSRIEFAVRDPSISLVRS